jgi:endonuclease/exonuclease/phosphatase family metal-dependent hydrolase
MMKNLNFVQKIVFILNILFALALGLSLMARFISPNYFASLAVLGLTFPILAVINFVFLILWISGLKKQFLLSFLVLGLSYFHLDDFIQFKAKHKQFSEEKYFRVMSYNINGMMYKKNSRIKDNSKNIEQIIASEAPDIICLQETYWTQFDVGFPHMAPTKDSYHIQSKHPIINWGIVPYADNNINKCYFADIKIYGDTLRVYNAHLASTKLSWEEKNAVKEINENLFSQDSVMEKNTSSILSKLKRAFELRADQVDRIERHIKSSPYKVILCGDFNDTASSYAYHTLTKELNDSFIESGSGFGNSFSELFFPLRIDYILHHPDLKAYNFHIVKNKQSDHLAIRTDFLME